MTQQEPKSEPESSANKEASGDRRLSTCSASWIDIREQKPSEDEEVLTLMKHGCISGYYDTEEDEFRAYYWHDMQWSARYWMPLPSPPNA